MRFYSLLCTHSLNTRIHVHLYTLQKYSDLRNSKYTTDGIPTLYTCTCSMISRKWLTVWHPCETKEEIFRCPLQICQDDVLGVTVTTCVHTALHSYQLASSMDTIHVYNYPGNPSCPNVNAQYSVLICNVFIFSILCPSMSVHRYVSPGCLWRWILILMCMYAVMAPLLY